MFPFIYLSIYYIHIIFFIIKLFTCAFHASCFRLVYICVLPKSNNNNKITPENKEEKKGFKRRKKKRLDLFNFYVYNLHLFLILCTYKEHVNVEENEKEKSNIKRCIEDSVVMN